MSKVKANIVVEKSFLFGDDMEYEKEWKEGDFELFLKEEGEYIDRLCKVTADKAEDEQGFQITFTITVRKEL